MHDTDLAQYSQVRKIEYTRTTLKGLLGGNLNHQVKEFKVQCHKTNLAYCFS